MFENFLSSNYALLIAFLIFGFILFSLMIYRFPMMVFAIHSPVVHFFKALGMTTHVACQIAGSLFAPVSIVKIPILFALVLFIAIYLFYYGFTGVSIWTLLGGL